MSVANQPQEMDEFTAGQFIPFSHHVTDSIIATKNGEYLSVWKLTGRSHQSASDSDCHKWVLDLNNTLKGISSPNLSLWVHTVRRKVDDYPDSTFNNSFARRVNERYKERFSGVKLMVNDLYLTVVYRASGEGIINAFAKYERLTKSEKKDLMETMKHALEEINRTLTPALKRYDGELLKAYEHNGHMYSAPLEFLAFLVNGEHLRMPICKDRFYDYMNVNRLLFSKWGALGEIRSIPKGSKYFGMMEIREYEEFVKPGHLDELLECEFEFILTHSFSCLSKSAGKSFLKRHKKLLEDSGDASEREINEIKEAIDDLTSGRFVLGEHHCTLTIFGDSAKEIRDSMGVAQGVFQDAGITPRAVDLALEAGFWAQLPANWDWRPRPAAITSRNFLAFAAFHNYMSGKPSGNPWGPAVTILKTTAKTPLYFNFHASKIDEDATDKRLLANTGIYGQSGSGKTLLIGALLCQAQKFDPTTVIFDKDRGQELLVLALGGRYAPLRLGEPTGFNPLQQEPTKANKIMIKKLIMKLATTATDVINHKDEEQIDKALDAVMSSTIPKNMRRLSMLLQFLPNPVTNDDNERPSVHARLKKWCEGGEYGWVFDNPSDMLDLTTHKTYGFDVTEFLDMPELRTPIMMYLLHRTEQMIDGRRFIYVLDEFWKLLQDEFFEDLAKNKLKTIRKENGIFIFATQDPTDAINSPIAKTLIQQCATNIFLANTKADHDDYVNGFKLTEKEFELVESIGEFSRRCLVKQGDNSALAEMNLAGMDEEILILSSTPDTADIAEQAIEEVGENPDDWMPLFFRRVKDANNERRI